MTTPDDMPADSSTRNPFSPQSADGPYAGRSGVLARIHRHLTDAATTAPTVITGRPKIGKTATLRQFIRPDDTIIGVYMPLSQMPQRDESAFLTALSQTIVETVQARGFVPDSLVRSPDRTDIRVWLAETCLPMLYRAIWRRRRIALLIDEAHLLSAAIAAGNLPDDLPAYLKTLLGAQFGVALAMDDADSDQAVGLLPLVPAGNVVRLGNLTAHDVAALCQTWLAPGDTDVANALFAATGGEPLIVQRYGYALHARRSSAGTAVTTADVKAVSGEVYTASAAHFKRAWSSLDALEWQVLTAISRLTYHDPTRQIDTRRIESWLVQTDYPLDPTAIKAALRGLEYRELVGGSASSVTITGTLMQRWLIDHETIGGAGVVAGDSNPVTLQPESMRRLLIVTAIAAFVLILVVAAVSLSNSGADNGSPVPTITLVSPPT